MDQLEIDGLRIAYERAGEGPPLVLLHGFVGDSREWRREIDAFSDEFTVVAWDAPEVVEHRLRQSLRSADLPPDEFVGAMIPTLFSGSAPADRVEGFAAIMAELHPAGFRAMARSLAEADLRDVLPRIDVPTLLLYGDKDVRAPLDVGEDLHAAIPTSRLVVMPGVGHMNRTDFRGDSSSWRNMEPWQVTAAPVVRDAHRACSPRRSGSAPSGWSRSRSIGATSARVW